MHDYEETVDKVQDFLDQMQRSRRGNLWCDTNDGRTVSIFANRRGGFSWSIADGDDVRYSPDRFESEEDAAASLLEALEE